ncbi:hypothetical protein WHI96_14590 [Pseudonocardia tropica]|uniref:Transposase n=1 Tax=Pseudonocardia tropica TaxID=681289 RepID=A0ABV1JVS8_9PSEU
MRHHRLALAAERALHPRVVRERSCGKRRFRDRIAADLALARIRCSGAARYRDPVRSYACPVCRGWHLTSRRAWTPVVPAPRSPREA